MKFQINDEVKLKSNGKKGQVIAYKEEMTYYDKKLTHTKKYYVESAAYNGNWYNEDEILRYDDFEFSKKFEEQFLNLLIDINLDLKDYIMVKYYADLKQKLGKE